MTSFPMTDGQREIARYIYNEVKAFGGKGVNTRLNPSDNQLIKYCRIRHYFTSRFPTNSWKNSGSPVSQFITWQ